MENRDIIWVNSAVYKEEYAFFIHGESSTIYKININSWEIYKVFRIKYKEITRWVILEIGSELYCVPNRGIRVAVYKLGDKECKYYESRDDETELAEAIYYNQQIWFIPRNLPNKMYLFSCVDHSFSEELRWTEELRHLKVEGRVTRWCVNKERIYLVVLDERRVLEYNLHLHYMTDVFAPLELDFYDIAFMEEKFYFITKDNKKTVCCWEPKYKSITEIHGNGNGNYIKLISMENVILIDAGTSLELLKNNMIQKTEVIFNDRLVAANFIGALKCELKWLLLPWGRTKFIEFSNNFMDYCIHDLKIPMGDFMINHADLFYESGFPVENYIKGVIEIDEIYYNANQENEYGKIIYNSIKNAK